AVAKRPNPGGSHRCADRPGSFSAVRLSQRREPLPALARAAFATGRQNLDPQPYSRALRTQRDGTALPRIARTGDGGGCLRLRLAVSAVTLPHRRPGKHVGAAPIL